MRYLLKNFIVFILTCCMTTCVCCANQDGYIKVIDGNTGKGIPKLNVTVNFTTVTTDGQGSAQFKYDCGVLKQHYDFRRYVMVNDPEKRFADAQLMLSKVKDCNFELKVMVPHEKVRHPDYKSVKKNLDNIAKQKGNITYYNVCKQGFKLPPTGVTGNCVKIFQDVNTQHVPGVALAKEYVNQKYKKDIQCKTAIRQVNYLDDYLACTTTDGKYAFEFLFDDLAESFDATIRHNTLKGLCTIYDGEFSFVEDRLFCYKDTLDQTRQLCDQLKKVSSRFPISAKVEGNVNRCYIDLKTKGPNDTLSTYGMLDPFVFQKYQTKFDNSTKVLIGRYVESKLGSDFQSLQCASMTKPYVGPRVSGTSDDILECILRVNSKTEPYKIEFVFDDLSEFSNTTSQGDKSKMTCLVNDGTYVAGQCVGVSEAQCEAIGIQFGVSIQFNQKMQTCELKDAQKQENVDALVESLAALGLFATTIVTGGTVLVVASAGAAIALTETKNILQNRATSQGFEILNLINQCGCKTKCNTGVCNNICTTCNSKNCDVNAIYEAIPFTMVYAKGEMATLVDKSIKSIEDSCITDATDRQKKINKLIDDMQRQKVGKFVIDTATVLSNVFTLKPTSQALTAIQGMRTVKVVNNVNQSRKTLESGKNLEKAVSTVGDVNTMQGMFQSDSTSINSTNKR